jgi:hypothetical protein
MHRSNVLSLLRGSVTNNNGGLIGLLGLLAPSLQSLWITVTTDDTQSSPKARSILASLLVFLLLWLVWFWLMNHSLLFHEGIPNDEWRRMNHLRMNSFLVLLSTATPPVRRNSFKIQTYVMTDGQSANLFWNNTPIWGLRPDLYYCQTVAGFLMWGALSDERTGVPFARVTVSSNKSVVGMYNLHFTCY